MLLSFVQHSSFFVAFACVCNTSLYSAVIRATDNSVTLPVTDASTGGSVDPGGYIPAPETASVGQTIVVKAIDVTGKPTQWEAVDMVGGGGYGWQLLTTVTTTENVTSLTVNTGDDGVMFKDKQLTELTAFLEIPGNADLTSTASLTVTCGWHVMDTQAAAIPNVLSSKKQYARVHCKACGDGALMWLNPPAGAPVHMAAVYGAHPFSVIPQICFFSTASDIPIPTGTVIKVYGR